MKEQRTQVGGGAKHVFLRFVHLRKSQVGNILLHVHTKQLSGDQANSKCFAQKHRGGSIFFMNFLHVIHTSSRRWKLWLM